MLPRRLNHHVAKWIGKAKLPYLSGSSEVDLHKIVCGFAQWRSVTEDGLERYPLADSYLSGRDLFVPELGAEANSVRYVLQRKFGFIPVLSNKRHALLHFLTQPGAAEQVEELQSLVNECWTVSLMELD